MALRNIQDELSEIDDKDKDARPAGKAADQQQEESFEIIETDDEGRPVTVEQEEEQEQEQDEQREEQLAEGEEQEDARLNEGGPTGETQEQKRQRRREERRERKLRRRQGEQKSHRLAQENAQLREQMGQMAQQLNELQGTVGQVSINTVDARLNELGRAYGAADAEMQAAITAGDGAKTSAALTKRNQAEHSWRELRAQRDELMRSPQDQNMRGGGNGQQRQQGPDPEVMARVRDFKKRHPWYNVSDPFSDSDSSVMHGIDTAIFKEGFDPRDDDYWEELEERGSKYLPHRFSEEGGDQRLNGRGRQDNARQRQQPNGAQRRRSPPVGGGGERQLSPNQVMVTPERKAAMIESGAWDDPVEKQKMLKYYRDYDRQHGPPGRNRG